MLSGMTATSIRRSVFAFGLLALGGFSVLNLVAQTPAGGRIVLHNDPRLGGDCHRLAVGGESEAGAKTRGGPALQFPSVGGVNPHDIGLLAADEEGPVRGKGHC